MPQDLKIALAKAEQLLRDDRPDAAAAACVRTAVRLLLGAGAGGADGGSR